MITIFNNVYSFFADNFNNIDILIKESFLMNIIVILIQIALLILFGVIGYSKIIDSGKKFHSIIKLIFAIVCPMLFPLFENISKYGIDNLYPTMPRLLAVILVATIVLLNCKSIGIFHGLSMSYFIFFSGSELARVLLDLEGIEIFLVILGAVAVTLWVLFGGFTSSPVERGNQTITKTNNIGYSSTKPTQPRTLYGLSENGVANKVYTVEYNEYTNTMHVEGNGRYSVIHKSFIDGEYYDDNGNKYRESP